VTIDEATVLTLLESHGDLSGLQMAELSGGTLGLGSIYALLHDMEDVGYIASRLEPRPAMPGWPRRVYWATRFGQTQISLWLSSPAPQSTWWSRALEALGLRQRDPRRPPLSRS
jgi:DNA-binding PadR family transcriptional regulator